MLGVLVSGVLATSVRWSAAVFGLRTMAIAIADWRTMGDHETC